MDCMAFVFTFMCGDIRGNRDSEGVIGASHSKMHIFKARVRKVKISEEK